ncbi:MAG: hypothetical protein HYZ44_07050 [Bacteroidetes bacterium]|nr:hypothetical protein [Bacteroidota bacterium]
MLARLIGTFLIGILVVGCAILSPKQPKESKKQIVPKELLDSQWTLETFQGEAPDCNVMIHFLGKGQLTFTIQDEMFKGDYLYYIVKDSVIKFHTLPVDKLAWPTFPCEPKPDSFARSLSIGDKKFRVIGNQLFLLANDRIEFVFKKR